MFPLILSMIGKRDFKTNGEILLPVEFSRNPSELGRSDDGGGDRAIGLHSLYKKT